jgi:hypothetical protein
MALRNQGSLRYRPEAQPWVDSAPVSRRSLAQSRPLFSAKLFKATELVVVVGRFAIGREHARVSQSVGGVFGNPELTALVWRSTYRDFEGTAVEKAVPSI